VVHTAVIGVQVCAFLERVPEGDTRNGRAWLGGPAHGKTELQRVAALLIALLHPGAAVGYCEYNKCELPPLQVLGLRDPWTWVQSPLGDLPAALKKKQKKFIVFFADEVASVFPLPARRFVPGVSCCVLLLSHRGSVFSCIVVCAD
jgi:hypothetical protein